MLTFLFLLGWLICAVLAYLIGKYLWIEEMKDYLTLTPVWSQNSRLFYIIFSLIFGPSALVIFCLSIFKILFISLFKKIGYLSNKPAKW